MRANWQAGKTSKQAIERETTKTSSCIFVKKKNLLHRLNALDAMERKIEEFIDLMSIILMKVFFNASAESRFADRLSFGCRSGWNSLFLGVRYMHSAAFSIYISKVSTRM